MLVTKKDIRLYNRLAKKKDKWLIDKLYIISCLRNSGIEANDELIKLATILYEMWLKDETNTCISSLSDMLVEIKDDINDDMTTRQILEMAFDN